MWAYICSALLEPEKCSGAKWDRSFRKPRLRGQRGCRLQLTLLPLYDLGAHFSAYKQTFPEEKYCSQVEHMGERSADIGCATEACLLPPSVVSSGGGWRLETRQQINAGSSVQRQS